MAELKGMVHLIEMRQDLKRQRDELTVEIEQIDSVIRTQLGSDSDGMVDNRRVVHWTRDTRREFDLSMFRSDHPDLYEQYRVERERRRLLYTQETE